MPKRLIGVLVVGLMRVTVATGAMAQEAAARPSVAIADVAITPGGWTLPPPQLSATIVELLMNELVSSQRFHLYDGQWLVPESEAGGHADLARLRAAAAEQRVDYLVLGRLTGFSSERKKKGFGGVVPLPLIGGFSRDQSQLRVSMAFRVVDVRTGDVVASVSGDGMASAAADRPPAAALASCTGVRSARSSPPAARTRPATPCSTRRSAWRSTTRRSSSRSVLCRGPTADDR
jgi:hypothetical protein